MKMNQEVLDGRINRILGSALERRGMRARNYREIALGQIKYTAGVLQERRGRIAERLERVRKRLAGPSLSARASS